MIEYLKRLINNVEVSEVEVVINGHRAQIYGMFEKWHPIMHKDSLEHEWTWIHECTEVTLFDLEIDSINLRRPIKVHSSRGTHTITVAHLLTALVTGAMINEKRISTEEYCSYFGR